MSIRAYWVSLLLWVYLYSEIAVLAISLIYQSENVEVKMMKNWVEGNFYWNLPVCPYCSNDTILKMEVAQPKTLLVMWKTRWSFRCLSRYVYLKIFASGGNLWVSQEYSTPKLETMCFGKWWQHLIRHMLLLVFCSCFQNSSEGGSRTCQSNEKCPTWHQKKKIIILRLISHCFRIELLYFRSVEFRSKS